MKKTWTEAMNYLLLLERLEKSLIEIRSEISKNPAIFRNENQVYYPVLNHEKSGIYLNKKSLVLARQPKNKTIYSRFETLEEACSFYQEQALEIKPSVIFNAKELEYWNSYIRSINRIHRKAKENKEQSSFRYYVVIDGEQTGIFTSEKTAIQLTKSKKNAFFNKCITLEEASETFAKFAFQLKTTELIRLNPVRIKDLEDSIEVQIKEVLACIKDIPAKRIDPKNKSVPKESKKEDIKKVTTNKEVPFYAVRKGRRPGIYKALPLTEKQVLGYPNADFRRFSTFEAALAYLNPDKEKSKPKTVLLSSNTITGEQAWHFYVDGSFSHPMGNASYGITIHQPKGVFFDGGIIHDPVYSKSSQGAEFYTCMRALELAFVNRCESIFVYYDNEETGRVVLGQKENMSKSEELLFSFVEKSKLSMNIQFIKIKSHSFVEPHNQADEIANNVRTTFGELKRTIEVGAKKSFFVNSKRVKCFQHNQRITTI